MPHIHNLIIWLLVGALGGWLAGLCLRGRGFGLLGNIIIGILGSFLAGWLLPFFGISFGRGFVWVIVQSAFGAIVLMGILHLMRRTF